jgi:hypothetical protein
MCFPLERAAWEGDGMYQLTQGEMLLLMGLLDADAVLGVHDLPEASSEEMAALLEAAQVSLESRGYLRVLPDGDVYPVGAILEVATVCAQPGVSLVATCADTEERLETCFIHYSQDMIVEDRVLEGGDRGLTVVVSADQVLPRVTELLHLRNQPAVTAEGFSMPRAVLERIRESVAEGVEAVADLLQAEGVPPETATSFARALVKPISTANFGLIEYADEQASMGPNLAVMEVEEGLWCMEVARTKEGDQVEVTACDAQMVGSRVGRYVDWIHGQM